MKPLAICMFAVLATAAPVTAQQPVEPNCPVKSAPLPAELSGWTVRQPLAAAADIAGLNAATLSIGKAADLTLPPTPAIHYALGPAKPAGADSHGGMVGFVADRAGTYRVAIGAAAWIDVVQGDKAAPSVAHSPGPACSGIGKIVDFALQPGRYVLQLSGTSLTATPVLIVRLP